MQRIAGQNEPAHTATLYPYGLRFREKFLFPFCRPSTWSAVLLRSHVCDLASVVGATEHLSIPDALEHLPNVSCTLYAYFVRMFQISTEKSDDKRLESTSSHAKKFGHEVPLLPVLSSVRSTNTDSLPLAQNFLPRLVIH